MGKQPPPKASSNQNSVVNNRKTDALAVTGGTSRVKRNSERSIASGTSKGSKKDDQCSTSEVSAEVSKLEDELKRERNHSQDLINKYLGLTEQLEKEKQTTSSISDQLQQKIQECLALKSQVNTSASVIPAAPVITSDVANLESQLDALQQEKAIMQKELERSKSSSHDVRRENAAKLQAAESQLKQIESRNNELQRQCNKYEHQLKTAVTNNSQIQAHEQKEGQLLYQISGLEERLKGMNKENELLRQQHEATYSEMSRLTESKIAMRKQNDAFKDEIDQLQQQVIDLSKDNALHRQQQEKLQKQQHHLQPQQNGTVDGGSGPSPVSSLEGESIGDASAAYDWSKANSDVKQSLNLTQLQASISSLGEQNESLRNENEELKREIHSIQQHAPHVNNHVNSRSSDDVGDSDESASESNEAFVIDPKNKKSLSPMGKSISVSEVGSRLKDTLLRLYPDQYSNQQPIAFQTNDWVSLVALLEHQGASQINLLSQQETSLNEEVSSTKSELHLVAAEKEDLARRNERYQAALAETEASVAKLDNALTTLEAEYREKLRCVTEENDILRHDTDKVVDLQMELDQLKIDNAKLQQSKVELEAKFESMTAHKLDQSTHNQEIDALKIEHEKNCEQFVAKIEILNQRIDSLSKENKDLKNSGSRVLELEDQINCYTADIAQLQKEKTELHTCKENAENRHRDFRAEFDILYESKIKIENELAAFKDNQSQSEIEYNAKVGELSSKLESETSQLNTEIAMQSKLAQDRLTELDSKNQEIKQLNAKIEELGRDADNCKQNLIIDKEGLITEVTSLKGQLESLQNDYKSLREKGSDLQEHVINEKNGIIDDLNSQRDHLTHEINEKIRIIDDFNKQREDSNHSINEKNRIIDDLNRQIQDFGSQITQNDCEISNLKNDQTNVHSQLEDTRNKLSEIESEYNNAKNEVDAKKEELASLNKSRSELEQQVSEFDGIKSKLEFDLARITAQLAEKSSQIDALNQEKDKLQSSVDSQRSEIEKSMEP